MSEVSSASEKGGANRLWMLTAVIAAVAVAGATGLLYAMRHGASDLPTPEISSIAHEGQLARYAVGSMAKLQTWARPKPAPEIGFKDADSKALNLSSYRGKIVVMNVWAPWCNPCITEMPTLAALQKRYPGGDLVVIPVGENRDEKEILNAKNFMGVNEPLPLLSDLHFLSLMGTLKLRGIPSTMIYDRQGREVARLEGEAKWDTPEAYAVFDALLKAR